MYVLTPDDPSTIDNRKREEGDGRTERSLRSERLIWSFLFKFCSSKFRGISTVILYPRTESV